MPTYDYKCDICGAEHSVVQSIGEYSRDPKRPTCIHGGDIVVMERKLSVTPSMSGLANALAGDRHYQNLVATDGTPIDSRTKHREYMKANNLSLESDYKDTWKRAADERAAIRSGDLKDPTRREVLKEVIHTAINQN